MKFLTKKRRHAPAIIIVSLIDILVVLLIFLMVTTTFRRQPAIQLALPEARQGTPGAAENAPVVIVVAKTEPYFYLRDLPVTLERLTAELLRMAEGQPQLAVDIRADTDAPFGQIIRVMEAARAANVRVANAHLKTPGSR